MRLMSDRIAALTGDTVMLELFLEGKDMHSYMGAGIDKQDYDYVVKWKDTKTKDTRYLGKFANLSLQYRVGIDTMRSRALTQYNLWLSEERAEEIKSGYLSTYPGVEKYWSAAIGMARRTGYAATMGGRYVMLKNLREYSQQQTAINTPIQGTGADMKMLGLRIISNYLREIGGYFAFDLHDALFLYIPDTPELLSQLLKLKHMLSNLPYEKAWGWKPLLPLPVDGTYGQRWGDMIEVKEK
jgi:DNA polymerase I-like protein with 3'-5' exonuclease and polymerase domains